VVYIYCNLFGDVPFSSHWFNIFISTLLIVKNGYVTKILYGVEMIFYYNKEDIFQILYVPPYSGAYREDQMLVTIYGNLQVFNRETFNFQLLGNINNIIKILFHIFNLLKPSGNFTYHQV
jgi:hypothetical protein